MVYLKDGTLTVDKAESQKLQHLATRYILHEDLPYKKSYSKLQSNPYLSLGLEKDIKVMQEIYDGYCESWGKSFPSLQSHQLGVLLAQDVR